VNLAALLLAIAVLLKSAQLPLHGWLIQVMEAPTPVSALLHAGIVNLGGYVLIRLAPLMTASTAAQTLLVIAGSLTAALAGVVMLTRITIKVRLAWSTVSQMGFMVMECGLGLYDLAFLHLLAHSLYKAHAFLTAGDAVHDSQVRQLLASSANGARRRGFAGLALAFAAAQVITAGSAWSWQHFLGLPSIPWIATALLAGGLATLLWQPGARSSVNGEALVRVTGAAQLYFLWHWGLSAGFGLSPAHPHSLLALWSLLVFALLYAAQSYLFLHRRRVPANALYDWVYAGFYLDERFTRLTFRLWPVRDGRRTGRPA
jgi:NAD(P)H-quinone oxidoreductase subunit 5